MKIDRHAHPFLDKSDLDEFVGQLKDLERATLIKSLDESIDDGLYKAFAEKIAELEKELTAYETFVEDIKRSALHEPWDRDTILKRINEISL
jgi:hypothetical protein